MFVLEINSFEMGGMGYWAEKLISRLTGRSQSLFFRPEIRGGLAGSQ